MKALLVTDNPDDLRIIEVALERYYPNKLNVIWERSITSAFEISKKTLIDVIFVDLLSSSPSIHVTADFLLNTRCVCPIIVITSAENVAIADALVNQDIQDYLIDSDLSATLIYKAVSYAIERKHHQKEADQHKRYMTTLLSKLSHDFDGHIRLLGAGITILRDDINSRSPLEPDELEWFDLMTQRVLLMEKQITGLVVLLRATHKEHHLETINLNGMMTDIDKDLASDIPLDYQLFVDDLPTIVADRTLLKQAFQAIIENGIVYNNKKPVITVASLKQTTPDQIAIVIKDNGVGIEKCYIGSIFDPFHRLHRNSEILGTGLGLSIAKNIVKQYQGCITVNSEIDAGSRFTITLPKRCVIQQSPQYS